MPQRIHIQLNKNTRQQKRKVCITNAATITKPTMLNHNLGLKNYELSNHLGNVMAVISDRKIPRSTLGITIDFYMPDIVSATDYYPFGMTMQERTYSAGVEAYRFGFNGKENDNEISVDGGNLDFGARIYDSRLGRWMAVDRDAMSTPGWSPYRYGFDNPLRYKDPNGNWEEDGHFWTVYALGVAMGMDKATARSLAAHAEAYDHTVLHDGTMLIRMHKSGLCWGKDGGLGTWADPNFQGTYHGLTGGKQIDVINNAVANVLIGNLNQIHTIGDAWSHSYLNKDGERVMYGGDHKYWVPFCGVITLEHKFFGENNEIADVIAERPFEYKSYITDLIFLFNDKKFLFNASVTIQGPNLAIFNYVQQNGKTKENNIYLLNSYVDMNFGASKFQTPSQEQHNLLKGYLESQSIEYRESTTVNEKNEKTYSIELTKVKQ